MNVNEFRNWLRESSYKEVKRYENLTAYSQGMFRSLYLYDNGDVEIFLISPIEFIHRKVNVKDFENGNAGSLKYKVMEEVEGEMKECEFYLYR